MLCSRSASLITRTLMSRDIATTILRTVSASDASPYLTWSSLVTPSTSAATSSPNSTRRASIVRSVSSTVSLLGDQVRAFDVAQVGLGVVGTDDPGQRLEDRERRGAALRGQAGEPL